MAVLFTHDQSLASKMDKLTINGRPLKIEKSVRSLGLVFDQRLSWKEHIYYIVTNCKKRLNLMRSIAGNAWEATKKSLLTIYKSLIRSVIDYGAIAYSNASRTSTAQLDVVQAKALRVVCEAVCSTPVEALLNETGEQPLEMRRLQLQTQYVIKVKATEIDPSAGILNDHWTIRRAKI